MATKETDLRQRKKAKSPKKAETAILTKGNSETLLPENGSSNKNGTSHDKGMKNGKLSSSTAAVPAGAAVPRHHGLDLVALALFIAGLATRLHHLGLPRAVVFDELHFGKFAGFYMKRMFFFDSQPPLGKQILALAAYFSGFDGEYNFERIGSVYTDSVPVWGLRLVPAVAGSLLLPASYGLLRQLGVSRTAAAVGGLLLLLDNAVLTQSRLMLMEPFLLLFSLLGLYCLVRFTSTYYRRRAFSAGWVGWMSLGFMLLGAAASVRYSGILTLMLGWYLVGRDFWSLVPDRSFSDRQLATQLVTRGSIMLLAPVVVYISCFYVHLLVLNRAGAHDTVMTSAFQASLEGGLASIIKNQPLEVSHGSQVTLRHTMGRTCWLHSHEDVYPVKYDDERGSSHQQQVSCYSFKDVNNWWIVKHPDIDDMRVTSPLRPVKDGDVVQIVHGMTSRALNSHDVAAPVSPGSQEVSCYIDYNISMPAQNMWRVKLLNPAETNGIWHAITSQVRLIHATSGTALKHTGRQLPDWGKSQGEVVCDKVVPQDSTIWNVEEHRYTIAEGSELQHRELVETEMLPTGSVELSFWRKFCELQLKMLFNNQETVQGHMYASDPLDWPWLRRGVAYWISSESNAQLHFIGNALVWVGASLSLLLYTAVAGFYLLRRRRACYDIPADEWSKMCNITQFILGGFLLNYIPYFIIDHTFFLHHYLPAYVFAVLSTACVVDHVYFLASCVRFRCAVWALNAAVVGWLSACVYTFIKFSVVSYGTTPLSAQDVQALAWRDTWDLIVHKP